ncbi:uncharacterized protein TrAFT101_004959 [Trichoderma asperellum]|uniref:uncharacterized protein n=1 Tax=Trichoderma asperellum TaxID=101201 RepID=UPI00332BE8A0|nr:hypothetical protein TrAFT101_004959 [Trichoderma asperellum]
MPVRRWEAPHHSQRRISGVGALQPPTICAERRYTLFNATIRHSRERRLPRQSYPTNI